MKIGEWIVYKNENWNIYNIINDTVVLHPETDNGVSNGSLIEIKISEL